MSCGLFQKQAIVGAASLCAVAIVSASASANENVSGRPKEGATISSQDAAAAIAPNRILNGSQLSEKIRSALSIPIGDLEPRAFGDRKHPFTTKNANSEGDISPVDRFPWRATGKLFAKFGPQTFVCTASVIGRSLLVTAAHCVHNFGKKQDGFVDSIIFEPARYDDKRPFGAWTGRQWWIPKAYFDGTDICSAAAPGVVCENDLAVIVLERRDEKFIADLTGKYGFSSGDFGYADFFGNKAAQITQLGYPSDNYDGVQMIRTDSLGYQDAPYNVIIGSAQTGGSSGGPWLENFGMKTSFTGTAATDDVSNRVVGTTSWGYISDRAKIQGASRFSKNTTYTIKPNIDSLVESACGSNSGYC
jgi:V8-like Glu-specific endopeptidase